LVTWGKPTNTLKVALEFSHTGVDYKISRSKSGAELSSQGLLVSGQSEVTAYVERLFKVNAATASAIMLANQGQVRGALDGGAVPLIEKLSDLGLIDSLVTLVQDNLPCGSTKQLELKVVELGRDLVQPTLNVAAEEAAVSAAQQVLSQAADVLAQIEEQSLEAEAKISQANLRKAAVQKSLVAGWARQKADLEAAVAEPLLPVVDLTSLEKEASEAAEAALRRKAHAAWTGTFPQGLLHLDRTTVAADLKRVSAAKAAAVKAKSLRVTESAVVKASGIYDESCALCGKLLQDVPEVVAVNEKTAARLKELAVEIAELEEIFLQSEQSEKELLALETFDQRFLRLVDQHSTYLTLDTSKIPLVVGWNPEIPAPDLSSGPAPDYPALLAAGRKSSTKAIQHNAAITAAAESLQKLHLHIAATELVAYDEEKDAAVIKAAEDKASDIRKATAAVSVARVAFADAQFALKSATLSYERAVTAWKDKVAALAEAKVSLDSYNTHNGIIKKLRDARPVVAKKLWNLVLASVSQHFSTIRGAASVVTRVDNGFMIDSKPVAAYSGSTKDSLGLAIRIALQKTFLGNIGFLIVDEPASGCDADRETDMLGVLVSAGYDQVLLVTHSSLGDVFAANLVEL